MALSKINNIDFWRKHYKFQKDAGYCGVASIQMVLSAAGINISQEDIAKDVYLPFWGVSFQIMLAYFSKYFNLVNYKIGSDISDIVLHLRKNHAVIVNWWDNTDPRWEDDGHYSLCIDYEPKYRLLTLADPTQEKGIWKIKTRDFKDVFYDYLDLNKNTYLTGLMIWVGLDSKKDN